MKKIAIFTTFTSPMAAYSLNRVVIDQIKMITMGGYDLSVIVHEGFVASLEHFPEDDEDVRWYRHPKVKLIEIPHVNVSNELYVDNTFSEDVAKLAEALSPIVMEHDVILTHDLVYQPAAVKHNLAFRKVLTDGHDFKTRFLHWIHSATKPSVLSGLRGGDNNYMNLLTTRFPNSLYIAFNTYSTTRIAGWFNIEESEVKYVPHPHDFYEGKDPIAVDIATRMNLLDKDVVCMYPCRLDRGKQPERVIKIMHQVKELGRTVGIIIADFHSTGGDKVTYREEMKNLGITMGLAENELVFLSEFCKHENGNLRAELPHQTISDLFDFTNVFIMPSRSETYSLVAQEAMAKRIFCIMNQDFPPFRSIYGDAPYYRQFSANIDAVNGLDGETTTTYSDEKGYYRDIANYISYVQDNTRVLAGFNKIRKERNLKTVFRKHLEPLFSVEDNKFNY